MVLQELDWGSIIGLPWLCQAVAYASAIRRVNRQNRRFSAYGKSTVGEGQTCYQNRKQLATVFVIEKSFEKKAADGSF